MTKRILVVEDNELNLKLFCDLLKAHGHETRAVSDGRAVLDEARSFQPDLVIMDIHLPHISGLDLIIALKDDAELASVPVMAVTAYAGKGDEDRIRAAGAEAYVSKPISVMKFVDTVGGLLNLVS
ncbi:response regulator [Sphingobium sp. DEHP117]|uniref:response regulator n=1 Tax=Sphingobium sp. DEHP117 TaxID=2993436 RepID=UPI0027D56CBE|nr:response regulator [Sphingobium sp. DEHP117]MDQ4421747.1 response regulator [Sphingobium sp. DEHP117]